MKNRSRKRKLTEEERKEAIRRVLERSAKDILYMGKILPNKDDPRVVAKYLAQELFDSPSGGARKLRSLIEWRSNVWRAERAGYDFRRFATEPLWMPKREQRFLGQMLIALGEYLLKGQPMFDAVDIDVANIKRLQPHIRFSEIVSKLEELHPKFTRAMLERRVSRLLKHIPREYLEPSH
jgi:hypothetical protein